MREVDWRLERIGQRIESGAKLQASLHGVELKGAKKEKGFSDLTKEQKEAISKHKKGLKNGK